MFPCIDASLLLGQFLDLKILKIRPLAFLDLKTKKLDFLDLKITVLGYIFQKISKLTLFYLISSKFFVDLFSFGTSYFFPYIPHKDPPAYYLFDFLDLITGFLDLKTAFLDIKKFFWT